MSQTNWKPATAAIVATTLVVVVVVAVIFFSANIQNTGSIKNVNCEIFSDPAATQPITNINWGALAPDSAVNVTIYVKNTGNAPLNWTAATSNWNPAQAQTYITCTADFKGAANTPPNMIIPVTLTLKISPATTGFTNYAFTITVTASG